MELVTRLFTRKGRIGEDAVEKTITEKVKNADGTETEVTKVVKVNPEIPVSGCLPDEVNDEEKTIPSLLALFDNDVNAVWNHLVIPYFNKMRLTEVQASAAGAPESNEYTEFFTKYVADLWPTLEGEELAKQKTTFARTISGMVKQTGMALPMLLSMTLQSKGIAQK